MKIKFIARVLTYTVYIIHLLLYAVTIVYFAATGHKLKDYIVATELIYVVYVKLGLFLIAIIAFCIPSAKRSTSIVLLYIVHASDVTMCLVIIFVHCLTARKNNSNYMLVMLLIIIQNGVMFFVDVMALVTLCVNVKSSYYPHKASLIPAETKEDELQPPSYYKPQHKIKRLFPFMIRKNGNFEKDCKGTLSFEKHGSHSVIINGVDDVLIEKCIGMSYCKNAKKGRPKIETISQRSRTQEYDKDEESFGVTKF